MADTQDRIDDADDLDELKAVLTEFLDDFEQIRNRVNNIEEKMETKVRVVDTDRGKRIVLENRQQTWFSPKYFEKILENIGGDDEADDEDVIKG